MDTEIIIKAAFCTVGVVQIIKNLTINGNGVIWTFTTILVGIIMTAMQHFLPSWLNDGILVIVGATLFYDTIYQSFEKLFKKSE